MQTRAGALLVSLALLATGCLTVNAKLRADGSGRAWIVVPRIGNRLGDSGARDLVSAPGLVVERTKRRGNTVAMRVAFADVRALEGMPIAQNRARVAVRSDDGGRTVTLELHHPPPLWLADSDDIVVSVLLPRPPTTAPDARVAGSRATWVVHGATYLAGPVAVRATF